MFASGSSTMILVRPTAHIHTHAHRYFNGLKKTKFVTLENECSAFSAMLSPQTVIVLSTQK